MGDTITVESLEQLKQFLNDKGVLEVVIRRKNQRIKTFQKIALNELPQIKPQELFESQKEMFAEQKEMLDRVIRGLDKTLDKTMAFHSQNMELLGNVMKVQKIGVLLNGANLCASCAGFAIMFAKLDKMSGEITQQINQLQNTLKQGNNLQSGYEFNKILADHTDMLDCRRKQQPYAEEKMRELVDGEYNVLSLLIEVFQKDLAADQEKLIFSMFSLLSMMTVSLRYFDEIYYDNNHNVLGDKDVWHSAHDKWVNMYSTMTSKWFVEKLQDYAMFEAGLDTVGVDTYYISLIDQVREQRQDIEDNQKLILTIGDISVLNSLKSYVDDDIKNTIQESVQNSCGMTDNPEITSFFDNAFNQMGLA